LLLIKIEVRRFSAILISPLRSSTEIAQSQISRSSCVSSCRVPASVTI